MRKLLLSIAILVGLLLAGPAFAAPPAKGLLAARAGFVTQAAPSNYHPDGPAEAAPPGPFDRIRYRSPAGELSAYVTRDPGDGKRRPAVLWAHGGFGGIGADDLKQVAPLVAAGIVVMCPSWRGENDNRGRYEMFYGEVNDALAALDHLAKLPYVDPSRVYVVGHSTGGTMALLVAESTDRARAVFSFGGAPDMERMVAIGGYEIATPPFPVKRAHEAELRSAIRFVSEIKSPTFYFEGARNADHVADARKMDELARAGGVPFSAYAVEGGDHFNIVEPLLGLIAQKITADTPAITKEEAQAAFTASRPVVTLKHAPLDLELPLRDPKAEVCQLLPEGAEASDACAGLDVPAMRAKMLASSPKSTAIALVRFDDWATVVVLAAQEDKEHLTFDAAKHRDEFMKGMKKKMLEGMSGRLRGDMPGTDHTPVMVDGRTALKTIFEMEPQPGASAEQAARLVMYVVPSDGAMVLVNFAGDAKHMAELDRVAQESIGRIRLRPTNAEQHEESKAYRLGYAVGQAVGSLVILGGIVAVVVFLTRKDSKGTVRRDR
ncbi:MAG: alpha/beta fold hydrolase [Minicystis sp.]